MVLNPTQTVHDFRHGVKTLFATLTVVMMLAIPASAQEIIFDPGLTSSGDIAEFEISPDGTQIVMVADLGLGQQTYVAGLLSGVANPATLVVPDNVGDNDGGVRWTPDGQSVVTRYAPTFTGNANEIFLLPADGSQTAQQLTFNSTNAFDPRISADGNRLFYSDGGSLFVTPIAGASETSSIQLNPGDISEIDTGTYSQFGSDIFFSGFSTAVSGADNGTREDTFYRTAADGSTANSPTNISINNLPTDTALNFGRLEVTPDGQTIVFQGDLTNDGVTELYSLDSAGGDYVSLIGGTIRSDFDVNFFKLSNDGSMIAFVSDYLTNGVGEAFIMPTTGGVPRRVSDSAHFNQTNGFDVAFTGGPERLLFSPDDSMLYYVSDDGHDGQFGLFRVSAVPEPSSLPLLFAAATFFLRRRR